MPANSDEKQDKVFTNMIKQNCHQHFKNGFRMFAFLIHTRNILITIILCCWTINLHSAENSRIANSIPANLEIDIKTQKKLASVKILIEKEQWSEAFPLLNQLIKSEPIQLVRINDEQYIRLRKYCHFLITQCSPEGLKRYRELVDQNIKHLHDLARKTTDESLYRKILQKGYASEYGDDALFYLGEIAWSEGKISLARSYWSQLIPLSQNRIGQDSRLVLRYPDSNRNRADILARLLLCSIIEGDHARAKQELQAFSHLYPNARGILTGRSGNLTKILSSKLAESGNWNFERSSSYNSTFGNNYKRTGTVSKSLDIGENLFSLNTPQIISENNTGTQPHFPYLPVIYDNKLFINNELEIFSWDLKTGKPSWPVDDNGSAVIYSSRLSKKEIQPTHPVPGNSHFTMTIDQGYLFARMGTTVLNKSNKELRDLQSELICLNLKNAEGKIEWMISSKDIGNQAIFEGSPVLIHDRGYVTVRKLNPDFSIEILCFDRKTGKPVWIQPVSSMIKPFTGMNTFQGHQLLSADDSSLYYQIHDLGLVSISQETGNLNWIHYFKNKSLSSRKMSSLHLLPPVISNNQIFVVNNSNQEVLSLDASTGSQIWGKKLDEKIEHLIGINDRRLIVSGKKLFALNIYNGSLEWQVGYENPAGNGHGRGTIAGHLVYWPTVEKLILVDIRTGKIRQRNHLVQLHGITGGNIFLTNNRILITGKNKISVFSPFGKIKKNKAEDKTISLFRSRNNLLNRINN
jgi:outer membrane protein assembly factor BamB